MRLKIEVTPLWWKIEAKSPETFAEWCVQAVRLILGVWPHAEVRLSREKVIAVVSFTGEEQVGAVSGEKSRLRKALDKISADVSDRSDNLPPEWEEMARRTGKPFAEGGAYASYQFLDWHGCVRLLFSRGMSVEAAEELLRSKQMRWCADGSDAPHGRATVEDLAKSLGAP